jgi:cell division protein DivIC
MLKRLPKFTRNFFFMASFFFLIWMLFLDSNDLIDQFKLTMKLKDLQKQKTYYLEKIDEVNNERQELFSNMELLEKFAREKYFMKRANEDIYIIVE